MKIIYLMLCAVMLSSCIKAPVKTEQVTPVIKSPVLCKDLPKKRWADFAKKYNGPAYRKNNYDTKLQAAYEKASGCIK
jgi:hypothetical protein